MIATTVVFELHITAHAASGPVVYAVNPNHGPVQGGTNVTIYGSGFNGATLFQGFDQRTEVGIFLRRRDEFLRVEAAAGQRCLQFGVACDDLIEFLQQRHGSALQRLDKLAKRHFALFAAVEVL